MIERLVLGVISKHMEEKKAIRNSEHRFNKGKSCLTNLIALNDGMTGWIDEGRAVDVLYLDFSKAIDTVSHSLFVCSSSFDTYYDIVLAFGFGVVRPYAHILSVPVSETMSPYPGQTQYQALQQSQPYTIYPQTTQTYGLPPFDRHLQ
ncbi:rna-directed dna polymerase from mobile element jockey- hypothetical protein [Limosa lapponica baueri]|uniref:Uncharacterized protein n=1 Tax=Limosa lapponica baueri TaxID=1758121 RepID=A0A2I0T6D1_LIMLA|nr:rna-directed dna polymerase from mobile element jockey- hypothetical protein [Limosa lapponica baueri]